MLSSTCHICFQLVRPSVALPRRERPPSPACAGHAAIGGAHVHDCAVLVGVVGTVVVVVVVVVLVLVRVRVVVVDVVMVVVVEVFMVVVVSVVGAVGAMESTVAVVADVEVVVAVRTVSIPFGGGGGVVAGSGSTVHFPVLLIVSSLNSRPGK